MATVWELLPERTRQQLVAMGLARAPGAMPEPSARAEFAEVERGVARAARQSTHDRSRLALQRLMVTFEGMQPPGCSIRRGSGGSYKQVTRLP